jgi:hypothetical protein
MRRRLPALSHGPRAKIKGISDLFENAKRQAPQTTADELWSMKIVRAVASDSLQVHGAWIVSTPAPSRPSRVAWRASDVRAWIESRSE